MAELVSRSRRSDVIVIDTRPSREYQAGHIPGALSIPVDQLQKQLKRLPRNKEYIAYCRGPYCVYADRAVEILKGAGRQAARLVEGFPEWQVAGLPVATGAAAGTL
jgi:rhodanese-related sulfurtransferase